MTENGSEAVGDEPRRARNPRYWSLLCAVVGGLFIASHAPNLDADQPEWDISRYQPLDEGYYSIPAFNLYHYGSAAHQVVDFIAPPPPTSALLSYMTWLSLEVFGNTYYGLRGSALLAGLLIVLLLFGIGRVRW